MIPNVPHLEIANLVKVLGILTSYHDSSWTDSVSRSNLEID
jgi:hypothetical protein